MGPSLDDGGASSAAEASTEGRLERESRSREAEQVEEVGAPPLPDAVVYPVDLESPPTFSSPVGANEAVREKAPAEEVRKTRGVKSLLAGVLMMVFAVSILYIEGSCQLGTEPKPHAAVAAVVRKVVDMVDATADALEEHVGNKSIGKLPTALFVGSGPALFLSGLVALVGSFLSSRRNVTQSLVFRGIAVMIISSLLIALLSDYVEKHELDKHESVLMEFANQILLDTRIVGGLTFLTGLIKTLFFKRSRPRSTPGKAPMGSFVHPEDADLLPNSAGAN